ncbi:MAG: hypothetical protein KAS32_14115 [Candidatus Peribacteraceae bacterium]|nr:hypothetical protein [Candidatus Peribacteraceae bacterium]
MKEKIQVLLAVDSDDYNDNLLESLEKIYVIHFLKNVDVHVAIMGKNTDVISELIPDWVKTKLEIKAIAYNYSYATNVLYKSLETSIRDDSPIVLTDGWTIISLLQIFNYEFKGKSLREHAIAAPVYLDNEDKPIKFDQSRLLSSVVQRARKTKTREDVPVIITTSEYFTRIGGLEEKFFSEFSRLVALEQLESLGLDILTAVKSLGLSFKADKFTDIQTKERTLCTETIKTLQKQDSFLSSNSYLENWGLFSDSIKVSIGADTLPEWNRSFVSEPIQESEPIKKKINSPDISEHKPIILTKTKEITIDINVLPKVETYKPLSSPSPKNTLIVVNCTVIDLVSITPLIVELNRGGSSVYILTDHHGDELNLINDGYFVKDVYLRHEITQNQILEFGKNIIITSGCSIPPPVLNTGIIVNEESFPIIDNFVAVYGDNKKICEPFCLSNETNVKEKQVVIITSQFASYDSKLWNGYIVLISSIVSKGFNVKLVNFKRETTVIEEADYKFFKNVEIIHDASPINVANLMKESELIITHHLTECTYIAYSTNKVFNLIEDKFWGAAIPDEEWINKILVNGKNTLLWEVSEELCLTSGEMV